MASEFTKKLIGWVRYTGATAAILQSRGITSVTHTGAGDHAIVLDGGGVDATECMIEAFAEGAAGKLTSYVHTSDTSKQILWKDDTGAASDPTTCMVAFYQVGFGSGL